MKLWIFVCMVVCAAAHHGHAAGGPSGAKLVHEWNRTVIEVIMEDGFGPPIAARIHAYQNLAGYQAAYHGEKGYRSLVGVLNGFKDCPMPDASKEYDWRVAAVAAYQVACSKLVYRINITDSLAMAHFEALKPYVATDIFERSIAYGKDVGKAINAYAKADGYPRTQGMPDWEWPKCDSCWEPTPPNYARPLSPYCGMVRTIALKSVDQFPVEPPMPFGTTMDSQFYKAAMAVYQHKVKLTKDEKHIADFWNDNPVVTNYHGHFIYNSRQISPGGHWMNIAMQIMKGDGTPFVQSMEVYSRTAFALFDGFTACWHEKYKYNLIRPVTYIQRYIDKNWEPQLQTPPFPEHASGHSTITAAAAEVLQSHFGDRSFTDSTEAQFGFGIRHFKSFREAAQEASISRFYGGIHYLHGCETAARHGKKIGAWVVSTITMKEP